MEKTRSLEGVLSLHEYNIPSNATLPDPPKGVSTETKILLPYLQGLCHTDSNDLYNEKTVVEFHHFLVATLLCYATALQYLRKVHRRDKEEEKKKADMERSVSGAFQRHINFLVRTKLLRIPSDICQQEYREFAKTKEIPWRQDRKTGVLQNVSESDGSPDFGDTAEDHELEEGLEKDQDPFAITDNEEITMAIQGWVKLFVQHLHAKSILESFARRRENEARIDFKIYGVCYPQKPLSLPTWEALEEILRSSVQDNTPEDKDKMIEVFRSHIQTSINMAKAPTSDSDDNAAAAQTDCANPSESRKNNIFDVINSIITQTGTTETKSRYYNMHCECALASLVAAVSESPTELETYADKETVAELQVCLVPSIHCI